MEIENSGYAVFITGSIPHFPAIGKIILSCSHSMAEISIALHLKL